MIVKCECGQKNRVPAARAGESAVCGQCKATLDPLAHPVVIEGGEFDAFLAAVDRPVLVDFWAGWCAPCRAVAPEVEKLAKARKDIIVAKFDIDREPVIAAREKVMGVPTFILYENGEAQKAASGYMTKAQLDHEFPPR